jgi:WD40 repeat protein
MYLILLYMQLEVIKRQQFSGHNGAVYALAAQSNTSKFYSGSSDKFITSWDLTTMQNEAFAAQFPAMVYSICEIEVLKLLLVGTSAGSVHIIDLAKKQEVKILQLHKAGVFDIQYNARNRCFYTAGGDGNFAVCSIDELNLIKIKKLCDEKLRAITINNVLQQIAVACGDGSIRVFDDDCKEELYKISAHQLSCNALCYAPDGSYLLSGGRDAHLNSWNTKDYSLIKRIAAHNFAIYSIVFIADGQLFATGSRDKTIKIWDAVKKELLLRINKEKYQGHLNSVNKLLWSNSGNYLISAGDDRQIMVWEVFPKLEV